MSKPGSRSAAKRPAKPKSAPEPEVKAPVEKAKAPVEKAKAPVKKAKRRVTAGAVGVAIVADDLIAVSGSDEAAATAAGVHAEARALEQKLARGGPGAWIRPDLFWALIANAEQVSRSTVAQSLAGFVAPFIEHSKLPEELVAWAVTRKGWHVVFYFSLPAPPRWMEGEHFMVPFEDLPVYFLVERSASDPADDVFIAYDGATKEISSHSSSHSDFKDEIAGARAAAGGDVWTLLERRTGLTLHELESAIPEGEPAWIVHRSTKIVGPRA